MKKILSIDYTDTSFSIAMFLLRAAAGAMIIPHGYGKLAKFNEYASGFSDPFYLGSTVSLSLTIFAEFFCAIFILVGLFTRLAAIPLVINMAVALFYAHNADLFEEGQPAALFLTIFIAILLLGPGKLSLDKTIAK